MKYTILLPFGCTLVIDVSSDTAQSTLETVQARLQNRAKLIGTIANAMRKDVRRQFSEGGDPPWQALAASTIAAKTGAELPALTSKGRIPWRLKQNGAFGPANILIATGRLRDSWGVKGDKDHVERVDGSTGEIVMGSKVPYAGVHQFGGEKEYPIAPKTAPFLVFMGANGKLCRARKVMHPPLAKRSVNITDTGRQAMADAFKNNLVADQSVDAEIYTQGG